MPVDVKPSQVQDLSKVKRTFTLGKGTKNEQVFTLDPFKPSEDGMFAKQLGMLANAKNHNSQETDAQMDRKTQALLPTELINAASDQHESKPEEVKTPHLLQAINQNTQD